MKKILTLLSLISIIGTSIAYNPSDVLTLVQSIGTSNPGCPTCDLTKLDFNTTLNQIDSGSDSFAADMQQKYGSDTKLIDIINGTKNLDLTGALLDYSSMAGFSGDNLNLVDANAISLNLSGVNSSGADFQHANLSSANLSNAMLYGSSMQYSSLYNANLTNADFSNARFEGAGLAGANTSNTNFANANLENLAQSLTQGYTYTDANGQVHTISKSTPLDLRAVKNLNKASFNSANLNGLNLTGVNLSGAKINSAKLETAILTNANLSSAQMSGTQLENVNAANVNFSNAVFNDEANFHQATLTNANFSGSLLKKADMQSANLKGANFQDADLTGVQFQGANLSNVIFNFNTKLDSTTAFDSNSSMSNSTNLNIMMNDWVSNSTLSANYNNSGASLAFYISTHMCYLGLKAACEYCPNMFPAPCYYYKSTNYSWQQIWVQVYPSGVDTYNSLIDSYNSKWGTNDSKAS